MNVPVSAERMAQLEDFARRRGKDTAQALDEALAEYLDWERRDYAETVEAVREGLADVIDGRTRPADAFLDELAEKHGRSR
jgi:predicted transcriptional regulator